jgi:hypothetical protein
VDILFLFVVCGATAAVSVVLYAPRPRRVCDVRMVFGPSVSASDLGARPLADRDNFG